jgi:hypothetical protein
MTLAERIHVRMIKDRAIRRRLEGIPPAVVEEVLTLGIRTLAEFVPMETHAHALAEIEFEACEACGHLIDPMEPEGARTDADGIWLCDACLVEDPASPPSPVDATPTPTTGGER